MREYLIGIDLGGTNIKSAIFTVNFEKIAECRMDTQAEKGSEMVLLRMLKSIKELLIVSNIKESQIRCIGIGVPGLLDNKAGISKFSPNFSNWENVHVSEWFESKLKLPTFIDNDVRMNLYGEWSLGAGKGKKNVVLVTLGTGLGSGVILDENVLYGATGSVGEIGHMNMYRSGRECRCGSSGCLGRYVSALGILRTLKEKIQGGKQSVIYDWVNGDYDKITAQMISKAFDEGDPVAMNTLYETGEVLGYGLVNVINLYNPECIIIGGGVSAAGDRLLKRTREIVEEKALRISRNACEIVTSSLGDASGMLGAAIYANNHIENKQ